MRRRLSVEDYVAGVLGGDRAILGRAITLMESRAPRHRAAANAVLTALMPHTGGARRVGITGVPGVGKSTFVEALGLNLIKAGHKVAVLAIDPSSTRSGGSIMGDKTRMELLSRATEAFIRPSPTSGTLGGVAARTRESLLICEAAGYDVVLVETVGVGQSEVVVAEMTDFFLVLMLAGAGDGLQGIKRGLMEVADMLAINKADGDNVLPAQRAAVTYRSALQLLHHNSDWIPPVHTCSAIENDGVDALWRQIEVHRRQAVASGAFDARRRAQRVKWFWALIDDRVRAMVREHEGARAALEAIEPQVADALIAPTTGAERVLEAFLAL